MVIYAISITQLLFNWFTKDDCTMGLYWDNCSYFSECSRTRSMIGTLIITKTKPLQTINRSWNIFFFQIVHAATGIVPSNVVLTTFQVFSRVMLVCGVLLATPNAIFSPGLPLALFAWSVTEIIRYGFYGFNLLNIVPGFLTFLRYFKWYFL